MQSEITRETPPCAPSPHPIPDRRHRHRRRNNRPGWPTTSPRTAISLATDTDRTLFFDFLPIELGAIRGFKTRFHLYTVPGQVFYDASRRLILKGVDGVVFVADSQEARMDANEESIHNLRDNLKQHGYDLSRMPYVLQLNKRDLPSAMTADKLAAQLRIKGEPVFGAVAFKGHGVFDTLKAVIRLVMLDLKSR